MPSYVRAIPGHKHLEAWEINDKTARRLGIANPEDSPVGYFVADPGETIWNCIERLTPWFEPKGTNPFTQTLLQAGQFYPRMVRPLEQLPHQLLGKHPGNAMLESEIANTCSQLTTLLDSVRRICGTVHPAGENLNAYGHDIRNLLMLACTEVEAQWRGVLSANDAKPGRPAMHDYFKLNAAMRLNEFSVKLPMFPWVASLSPFQAWNVGQPSQSLDWYDAYNAAKHDRETNFHRSTLHNAITALAACFIMIVAQFGLAALHGPGSEIASFFRLDAVPRWPSSDLYIFPYEGTWTPATFKF